MTGPATLARDADVAAMARDRLDVAADAARAVEDAHRAAVAALVELWPSSAWLVAGARDAKQWLVATSGVSWRQAKVLSRVAERCAAHPELAEAVVSGALPWRRVELLAKVVTDERASMLAGSLPAILELGCTTGDDDAFETALRYWAERVDELIRPRRPLPHALYFRPSLFGGGRIEGDLSPVAFDNVTTTVDAWTDAPDPVDAPYRRSLGERRADGLDDALHFASTHSHDGCVDDLRDPDDHGDHDTDTGDSVDWDEIWAEDTWDGTCPTDELDEALANPEPGVDPLRAKIRRSIHHQRRRARRRVKARSGVTVNVHLDLRTLLGDRDIDDFDELVFRGEGWNLTRSAVERYRCDSALVATLFAGRNRFVDANAATEQFNRTQRRAIAAMYPTCVGPGCTVPANRCDIHHVHHLADDGPTVVANGVPECRFHHRLLHEHGWHLERERDGTWTTVDPHGNRHRNRRRAGDQDRP